MIQTKQLFKNYSLPSKTIHVLKNINLQIKSGEIFGIVGESGAGKSTLIRLLNFLEKPSSGQVFVEGTDLGALSTRELRKKRQRIGMIFQHFNLLRSRTVFENIALPLELVGYRKNEIEKTILPLLEWMCLLDHQDHYPDQLSGGQKQRVAIARALATKPSILLCDEPTSSLDPKSTFSILNLLEEIKQKLNVTIVIISHEIPVIKRICDRGAFLNQGELIEADDIDSVLAYIKSTSAKVGALNYV